MCMQNLSERTHESTCWAGQAPPTAGLRTSGPPAAEHMSADERAASTVYTSGEHCPMCAAAHAWVGLGRIVYASSSNQLVAWLTELGAAKPPVTPRPIHEIAPDVLVDGPVPDLAERVQALHARRHAGG